MTNFILRDPDCVLIHIKKTGGSSIRKGIWNENYDGPFFGFIPQESQDLFKFAFVRNPIDRFLSAYKMFAHGTSHVRKLTEKPKISLEEFSEIVFDDSIKNNFGESSTQQERIKHHTSTQTHPLNCLEMADYIARYENYEDEVRFLCGKVGKVFDEIPCRNKTVPRSISLGMPLVNKLISYYEKDFKFLGYSMEAESYVND